MPADVLFELTLTMTQILDFQDFTFVKGQTAGGAVCHANAALEQQRNNTQFPQDLQFAFKKKDRKLGAACPLYQRPFENRQH